ncbi:MAG: glycoside hydrolase family 88 protein [Clostridium sp.]|uniref:glycoside hydrolase family 88 protein n=1 Tax=Clostridium sp. TaxID=1506 RepID=UPI0028FE8D38|nr:glycoside hydrolase family 88 protein [Clostridium sp.]MDU1310677.1 glycoside hydrolase family 88 protein [Clostridium sp.]MDU1408501.1 glycoside hydrolase family 88 protein [Clostridium sp.]
MFRDLVVEDIKDRDGLEKKEFLTKEEIKRGLDIVIKNIDENLEKYTNKFPSACTTNLKYRVKDNDDWTNGFWTGMLWLAYEYTGDDKYKKVAQIHTENFEERYNNDFVLNHHDLGFLYSLSAVADYRITGSEKARELGLKAANKLKGRYQEKGKFIQAWGNLGDESEYRLIIDCFLNLPLLYWAYEETEDQSYLNVANNHFNTAINNVIRKDSSTYHTYYFDKETGEPTKGVTHQGFKNDSCWARGQAWAILGMPLNYRYNKNENSKEVFEAVTNYYLNRLPEDLIPYWDLIFTEKDGESRDSSSAVIIACGIFERNKFDEDYNNKDIYNKAAHEMLRNLINNYTTVNEDSDGILMHGVYSWQHNKGIDECNLWGDYFFMEALMRLYKEDWRLYW